MKDQLRYLRPHLCIQKGSGDLRMCLYKHEFLPSSAPMMSAAGIYTAERFCTEDVCIFVEKRSTLGKKLFWNQCNNF
jgi:hypothetical protein